MKNACTGIREIYSTPMNVESRLLSEILKRTTVFQCNLQMHFYSTSVPKILSKHKNSSSFILSIASQKKSVKSRIPKREIRNPSFIATFWNPPHSLSLGSFPSPSYSLLLLVSNFSLLWSRNANEFRVCTKDDRK